MDRGPQRSQLLWMIRLRWYAAAAVVVLTLAAGRGLGLPLPEGPLVGLGLAIAAYNALFLALLSAPSPPRLGLIAAAQVVLDLCCLTLLVHRTGGAENPYAWVYVFHAIIAGIVFSRRAAWAVAGLIVLLFTGLTGLETSGLLHHHPFPLALGGPESAVAPGAWHAAAVVSAFVTVVAGACWFTTALVDRLRVREREGRLHENLAVAGQLAAGVAHEILNPLGGIQRGVELLRGELEGPRGDRHRSILDLVAEGLARIERIARGLVIQGREVLIHPVPCLLGDVLEDAARFARHRAEVKGVRIDLPVPDESLVLRADPMHLSQAFVNVLINACDAVDLGGHVWVTARRNGGDRVHVRVMDNGHGIDPRHLARVFEPFFTHKAQALRDTGLRGTGLGLATTRRIVEAHGGRITADSPQGGPTSFHFDLPLDRSAPAEAPPVPEDSVPQEAIQ